MIGTIRIEYSYPGGEGRIEIDALEYFPVSQEKIKKLRKVWDMDLNRGRKETNKLLMQEAIALLINHTEDDIRNLIDLMDKHRPKRMEEDKLKSLKRRLHRLKANAEEVSKWWEL